MRILSPRFLVQVVIGFMVAGYWTVQSGVTAELKVQTSKDQTSKDQTEVQLRAALTGSLSTLGNLQPWQQIIFQDEVLTQPQRFVKNYQSEGLKVDVDSESVRAFLKFHSSPGANGKQALAVVTLKTAASCSVCSQVLPTFRTWIRSRLERRGFQVDFMNAEGVLAQMTSSSPNEALDEAVRAKGAQLFVMVEWAPVPVEELDTAHADEKKYRLSAQLEPLGSSLTPVKKDQEILELESFDVSLSRVWTAAMTELGVKAAALENFGLGQVQKECWIEVTGIRDFQQLKRVKALFEAQLKDVGTLEDRVVSREKFVFAVSTQKSNEQVKQLLSQLPADSGVGTSFHWTIQ